MDNKKFIDVDLIISECGVDSDKDRDIVIQNIMNLENKYNFYELIQIYNQLLVTVKDPKILMNVITCADKFRDSSTLGPLVDLLLTKNNIDEHMEIDDLINLRWYSCWVYT